MPVGQRLPLGLARVLADTVLYDWTTGKSTIQGTYETLESGAFPFTQPSIVVYVALTEGHGDTEVRLRLVDGEEARPPLFELEALASFPDPVTMREVIFS